MTYLKPECSLFVSLQRCLAAALSYCPKLRKSSRSQRGVAFVEAALLLPIYIGLVLGAGWVYYYIRTYVVLGSAVQRAAEVAVLPTGEAGISWDTETLPYRPYPDDSWWDQCRGQASAEAALTCMEAAIDEGRMQVMAWAGAQGSDFSVYVDKVHNLPFSLFEAPPADSPGYYPVQVLPMIGIEKGCFETINSTEAFIAGNRTYTPRSDRGGDPDDCRHVKPMYWQSPVRADFDGDRKEDLVFFKPNGSTSDWGDRSAAAEMDFIVFYSSRGYSYSGGIGTFNLTTGRALGTSNPYTLPVVADWDRDGLADYAVYDVTNALLRIAYSSARYHYIGEYALDEAWADGNAQNGIIAIPGTFETSTVMQLALVKSGGTSSQRFQVVSFAAPELPAAADSYPVDFEVHAGTIDFSLKEGGIRPDAGTVSVPAFADYDDDGIVEAGYLSWPGGNMAGIVAGNVPDPMDLNPAFARFESNAPDDAAAEDRIMNPFDMISDASGNVFYTDAVDSRLWKISIDQQDFRQRTVDILMPSDDMLPRIKCGGNAPTETNANAIFPQSNVWNIPEDAGCPWSPAFTELESVTSLSVDKRLLRHPRKMTIAADGVMYIADWGNGRILRIEPDGDGEISIDSTSRVVLGGMSCRNILNGCPALSTSISGPHVAELWEAGSPKVSSPNDPAGGMFAIWPSALEVVYQDGDTSKPYALAFSSGTAVYLISHKNKDGGPKGEAGEAILRIAGFDSPEEDTPANYAHQYYTPGAKGWTSRICPVVDLQYDALTKSLLAASSCSLQTSPLTAANLARNTGGILSIAGVAGDFSGDTSLSILAGGFWKYPCRQGKCSEPAVNGTGLYQRKIDIAADEDDIPLIDMINPVDLEIGPDHALLFIDQWNSAPEEDSDRYISAPGRSDHQHQQGAYLIERYRSGGTKGKARAVIPLFNSQLYGQGSIPVESAAWRSPFTSGGNFYQNIPAHKAPAKLAPFPATAGLLLTSEGQLLTSTPFLANPGNYDSTHPYYVKAGNVGFIYGMEMDFNGDGTLDSSDIDIDGDGSANVNDALEYCQQTISGLLTVCRPDRSSGTPFLRFFKLSGADLALPGGLAGKSSVQYQLINSVSECGSAETCADDDFAGRIARPEVWATLLNFGDDRDFDAGVGACTLSDTNNSSAYYNCKNSSNGPVAVPSALHAFVGKSLYEEGTEPAGAGFFSATVGAESAVVEQNLMLFPAILSSTRPRENGIKPTMNSLAGGTKAPAVLQRGTLCGLYQPLIYGSKGDAGTLADAPAAGFGLNISSYLKNYTASSLGVEENPGGGASGFGDNDNLNYVTDCAGGAGTDVYEGIILQLDHDETAAKLAGTGDDHWPDAWITGHIESPENNWQFLLVDTDGDGIGNPSFLSTETFPNSLPGGGARSFLKMGPYQFVSTGLKRVISVTAAETVPVARRGVADILNVLREPVTDADVIQSLGFQDNTTSPVRPVYAGLRAASFASNLGFDKARQGAGETLPYPGGEAIVTYDQTLMLGLDFEPFVASKLGAALDHGLQLRKDAGAARYIEFGGTNRFDPESAPALILAKNILKLSLGLRDEQFTEDIGFLMPGGPSEDAPVAYVGLVKWKDPELPGDEYTPCTTADDACVGIVAKRRINIFGVDKMITRMALFDGAKLGSLRQQAAPE